MKIKYPKKLVEFFREQGARGGKAAASRMTPGARKARAKAAAQARWNKKEVAA
jgi:hypothetical protein